MPKQTIEMKYGMSVEIKVPHLKYVDQVLTRYSYEELMWSFGKSNEPTKEISESYGAFYNLKKITKQFDEKVEDFTWLHIGDGAYARTSLLFTLFSKSINYSIDPALNIEFVQNVIDKYSIRNIDLYKEKFEDVHGELMLDNQYGIVCMHAHVNLEEVDRLFPDWKYLLTCPCCFPRKQTFTAKYMREHNIIEEMRKDDYGILSPHRDIRIYRKVK